MSDELRRIRQGYENCREALGFEHDILIGCHWEFDLRTSSWVRTPSDVRRLGGALFCDRRFGKVFLYHNGAESYYGARGFRGLLMV